MQSGLLSPHSSDLARIGAKEDKGILVNGEISDEEVAEEVEVEKHDDMLDLPPPPEPHEMQRPKAMKAPSAPSRQERAEHDITHCPFQKLV